MYKALSSLMNIVEMLRQPSRVWNYSISVYVKCLVSPFSESPEMIFRIGPNWRGRGCLEWSLNPSLCSRALCLSDFNCAIVIRFIISGRTINKLERHLILRWCNKWFIIDIWVFVCRSRMRMLHCINSLCRCILYACWKRFFILR